MLDYKDIITKHYALGMSGTKIAEVLGANPIALLKGNKTLAEFGIRNGSMINFTE